MITNICQKALCMTMKNIKFKKKIFFNKLMHSTIHRSFKKRSNFSTVDPNY